MRWLLVPVLVVGLYTAWMASRVDSRISEVIEVSNPISTFTVSEKGDPAHLWHFERLEGQSVAAWVKTITSAMDSQTLCTTWTFELNGEEVEGKVTTICGENEGTDMCQQRHQEEVDELQKIYPPVE